MSTYDDASLIYYPSGYKASKAYSLKPTDGSGDLTFTRASSATRVNEQGLIEGVRTNLALYSQQFENAYWTKQGSTVTSGFSSPLAAYPTSGYKLGASDTISTPKYINSSIITVGGGTATIVTSQFFIKKGEKTKVGISDGHYNQGWVAVNLTDGSIISNGGVGYISNSVQLFVDDWYLISLTFTTHSSGTYKTTVSLLDDSYVSGNTKNYAYVGVVGQGAYIFGSQSELGASATEYIPTTTTAVSVGMLANVPRIDYTGGGCGKLLLEPQRSNLVLQSEDISSASWTKGNTPAITSNIAIAPDGTMSADGIQSLTGGAYRNITQNFTVASNSTVTSSFFVKKETSETFYGGFSILFQGGTTKVLYVIVDAVNGTGTVSGSTLTGTIKVEDYNNYWRISATTTDNGSNTICRFTYEATLSTNGTTLNVGAGSVRTIWGFQLEIGSYPTSYIPTTTTAVTRVADTVSKTGISSLINSVEGVLYAEIAALADDGTARYLSISDGSFTNRVSIYFSSSTNIIGARIVVGGTSIFLNGASQTQANSNKIAIKWKLNDYKLYINGVEVAANTSGNTFTSSTLSQLSFNDGGTGTAYLYGKCQNLMIFPSALSDDQLADLTGGNKTTFNALATFYGYTIL